MSDPTNQGAEDERARAAWEDSEGAGVVTSAGIWHAALQYERRRVEEMLRTPAAIHAMLIRGTIVLPADYIRTSDENGDWAYLCGELDKYRKLYGPVNAPNARATHQQLKQMADDARKEATHYRLALESIARAPAFDANTQAIVDLARRTLNNLEKA